MSCGDVRNWLAADGRDSAGGGHLRTTPPDVATHLAWCSQCREEVAAALRFEDRLSQGLVAWVNGSPEGSRQGEESAEIAAGRARLQSLLDARLDVATATVSSGSVSPHPVAAGPLASGRSRWRWGRSLVAVVSACLLVALLAVWQRPAAVERVALERASLSASARLLASNHPYQGVLPSSIDGSLLRGAVPAYVEVENQRVEVLRFAFRQRSRVIEGRLLVIPVRMLADVPAATYFMGGPLRYTDQFAASWWVEGKFAFACCLTTADEAAFRALLPRRLTT